MISAAHVTTSTLPGVNVWKMAEVNTTDNVSLVEKRVEVNNTTEKSVRPKSSKVPMAEHLTLKPSKKTVCCKMCIVDLAWHDSTTSLREHLKRKHVGAMDEGNSRYVTL